MLSNKRDFSLFAIFCTALLATAMVLVGFTRAQEKNIPNEKTADSAGEQWPIDSKTLPEPSRLLMSPVVFRHAPNGDKIAAEAFDLTENVRQAVEKRHLTETEAWSEIHVLAQQMIAADESNGGLVNEFQPNSYTLVVAAKGQRCWELRGAIDAWAKGIQTNREIVDAWNANAFEMVCLQTRIVQFPPELMPEFLKATGTEKKDFGPNKEIMRSLAMQNLDFIWRFRDDHYDDVELSEETVITMAKGEKTQVERTADIEFDFKKQNELGQFVDSESVETVGMSLEFTTVATQNPKSLTVGLVAEDRLLKAKCDGKLEPDRWVRRLSTGWELEYGQSAVVAFQTKDVLDNPGDKTADQAKDVIKAILITVTPVGGTFIRN